MNFLLRRENLNDDSSFVYDVNYVVCVWATINELLQLSIDLTVSLAIFLHVCVCFERYLSRICAFVCCVGMSK